MKAILVGTPRSEGDSSTQLTDEDLAMLQFSTVLYYLHETNPDNGLVRDKTDPSAPASIAAMGMALATIPVIVERGILFRDFAVKITRKRLRYLFECPQGPDPDASGYKGFFYHFLNIETGRRAVQCELSTIDSAFLLAGALTAAAYFDRDTPEEAEVRTLANALYRRVDWNWARDGGPKMVLSGTVIRATTKACCCISSASVRQRILCRSRAIRPTAPRTSGKRSTIVNCCIQGRSSRINSRTCG